MTPLAALIRARIETRGPMRIDEYMALCLGHPEHGYYTTRDPLGAAGDFVTAPEVSQMFGELIGAWTAQVWADQGRPAPFVLAELGPGRGTLMRDALRAARAMPGFASAAQLWLVETSPVLRARQAGTLAEHAPRWAETVASLPDAPLIAIANEFFDALPVRQFHRTDIGWQERLVNWVGEALRFTFGPPLADADLEARFPHLPDGVLVEVSAAAEAVTARLAGRVAARGGAVLVFDYGAWDGAGDTFQAIGAGRPADPLAAPGEADLTTHVRFKALAEAAGAGVRFSGPLRQGEFLERLGIGARAEALARDRPPEVREAIAAQHRRLTHPEEMGDLFKVSALTPWTALLAPGFDP